MILISWLGLTIIQVKQNPLVNEIYRGDLGKIPEKYYDIEVLSVGEVIASSGDSKRLFEFRVDIK